MITASQLQSGMIVRIDGQLFRVLECSAKAGGGQLGGTVKTKLQNTSSGRFSEPHFRPDQRIEDLQVERHVMEFLYADSDSLYLMNPETYEQMQISRSSIGGPDRFLTAGMQVGVELFQGLPISLIPPTVVDLLVADTAPTLLSCGFLDAPWGSVLIGAVASIYLDEPRLSQDGLHEVVLSNLIHRCFA